MKLRNHPLLTYRGMCSWPPAWIDPRDMKYTSMEGEVGVLTQVLSDEKVPNKCVLVMELESKQYRGCLIFDDEASCQEVQNLLRRHLGRSIKEIGDLDWRYSRWRYTP